MPQIMTQPPSSRPASVTGDRDMQDRGFEFRVTLHPLALFPRD